MRFAFSALYPRRPRSLSFGSMARFSPSPYAAGATPNFAAGDPTPQVTTGWGYRAQDLVAVPPLTAHIFANGYDPVNNLLSNEIGYTTTIP